MELPDTIKIGYLDYLIDTWDIASPMTVRSHKRVKT